MATEPLQIEPPGIQFVYEVGRELPCRVQLRNTSDAGLRVEIKSNGWFRYRIEPPKLLLEPGARGSIDLTCEALKSKPGGFLGANRETFFFEITDSAGSQKHSLKMKVPVTFADLAWPHATLSSPGNRQGSLNSPRASLQNSPRGSLDSSSGHSSSMEALKKLCEEQKTTIAELGEAVGQKQMEKDQVMTELEMTKEAKKKLQDEMEVLRGGRTSNAGEMSSTERKSYEQKIENLIGQLDAAKDRAVLAHRSLLSVRQSMAEQKETSQKEKEKLAEEKAKMEKELEATRSQTPELAELRLLCSEAVTRCERLKEQLDEKVKELQVQKQACTALQRNLDQGGGNQQDDEVDRLRRELQLMTENCNQGLQQIEESLDVEQRLAQESNALSKEKQALKSRNDLLEAENVRLKRELMDSKLQLAPEGNIPEELLGLRRKIQEATSQIERQDGLHRKVREELTKAKMEIKRLEKSGVTATGESYNEGNRSVSIGQQDGNFDTRDSADKRIAELEALVAELTTGNHNKRNNSIPNGRSFENSGKDEDEEEESLSEKLKELTEENDNLIDEVQYLQREKEQLGESIRKLNDRLAKAPKEEEEEASSEKLKDLTEENDNLIDEVQYLQREKEQLGESIQKLNDRLAKGSKFEEEINSLKTDKEAVEAEIAHLRKLQKVGEEKKQQTKRRSNGVEMEIDTLRNKLKKTEEESYFQKQEMKDLQAKLDNEQAHLKKVEAELERLEREGAYVLTQCEQLKKQLREVKEEEQKKGRLLLEQKSEIEYLQQEVKDLEEQGGPWKKQVSDLQEALERTESSYNEIERFSDSLRVQVQKLQNQRADIEAEAQRKAQLQVVSMNSELNSAREQTRQVLSQMEDLQSSHESQVSSLQASLKDLRAKMEESQPDSVYLSQCLASLEAEKKELETVLSNAKDKLNQTLKDLSEATSARTEAENELAAVKEENEFLELKMEGSAMEARKYSNKVDLLTKRLRDVEEERRRLEENEEEITRLQAELRQGELALQTAKTQLQRQKQEEARRFQAQQENLETTQKLIETLQHDALDLLNEKGHLESFMSTLEILDPYRRGHLLKLRKRPNFTCTVCRQIGGGFGWKCGDRSCPDMIHVTCAVPRG